MGSGEHSIDLPCYEIRRVRYRVWTDADMSLFNELDSLAFGARQEDMPRTRQSSMRSGGARNEKWEAYRADCLRHLGHAHDDGEAPPAEGRDGELVLDVAELCARVEHAHVV